MSCPHGRNSTPETCTQCLGVVVARIAPTSPEDVVLRLNADEQRHRQVCRNGGHARARRHLAGDHQRAAAAARWSRDGETPEQRAAEIKRLHNEGLPRWQIAEQVGVSKTRVGAVLGRATPEEISAARRHAASVYWAARRASKETQC